MLAKFPYMVPAGEVPNPEHQKKSPNDPNAPSSRNTPQIIQYQEPYNLRCIPQLRDTGIPEPNSGPPSEPGSLARHPALRPPGALC